MKTRFQKYAIGQWLVVMLLLSLVNAPATWATDRDSLQKAHIAASVKQLNRAITYNTLKKPMTATKYLVDRLNYVSANAQERIEKVLEYLQKNTGKELYVIITRSPDMVNEQNPTEKFQKETKDFTDKVYAQSMMGTNGVLVTINFVKSSTRQKIGVNTTYLQGTSIATGNDLAQNEINKVAFQTALQNDVKNANSADDLAKLVIYQVHQKTGNLLVDLNLQAATAEKLTEYETKLGLSERKESVVALHTIVEVPTDDMLTSDFGGGKYPKYEGAVTPSGVPISVEGMTNLQFWKKCNGALMSFKYNNIDYEAVTSRAGNTSKCGTGTKFWGYLKKGTIKAWLESENSDPKRYTLITKGVLNPRLAGLTLWFPKNKIKILGEGARLRAQYYKSPYLNSSFSDDSQMSEFWKILEEMKLMKGSCIENVYWDNVISTNYKNIVGMVNPYHFDADRNRVIVPGKGCDLEKVLTDVEKKHKVTAGWGTLIYLKHYKTANVNKQALKEFANMITSLIGKDESLMLVNFEEEFKAPNTNNQLVSIGSKHTNGRPDLVIREMLRLGYRSKDDLKKYVQLPYKIRNAFNNKKYTVWATYDPWEGNKKLNVPAISMSYNAKSRDFTVKGKKVAYEYSIQDLIGRHVYLKGGDSHFKTAILLAESSGAAIAISAKDGAEQYKALFGSNSAVFSFAMYVGVTLGGSAKLPFELMESFGRDVSKFIEKHFMVPEYWWNPECAGGGKRAPGEINCKKCVKHYSMAASTLFRDEASRLSFAFMAGLFNGIIGQVSGLAKMAQFIGGYVSNPSVSQGLKQSLQKLHEKGIIQALQDIYKKETCNDYVASYYTGKHLIDLLMLVLGTKDFSTLVKNMKDARVVVGKIVNVTTKGALKAFRGTEKVMARITQYVTYSAKQPVKLLLRKSSEGGKNVYHVIISSNRRGERIIATIRENGTVRAFENAVQDIKTTKAHILSDAKKIKDWAKQVFGGDNWPNSGGSLIPAGAGAGQNWRLFDPDFKKSIYNHSVGGKTTYRVNMYGYYKATNIENLTVKDLPSINKILESIRKRKKLRGEQIVRYPDVRAKLKEFRDLEAKLTSNSSTKNSRAAIRTELRELRDKYRASNDPVEKAIAEDLDEAFDNLYIDYKTEAGWSSAIKYVDYKNSPSNHKIVIDYFEGLKRNLELQGLPNKLAKHRQKEGIYKGPNSGGTVAAAKAEIRIGTNKYEYDNFKGQSPNARKNGVAGVNGTYGNRYKSGTHKGKKLYDVDPIGNAQFVNHAEQDVLGNIDAWITNSKRLGTNPKSSVVGEVYIHVDRPVCSHCTAGFGVSNTTLGPLYLFSKDYPNIKVTITNSVDKRVITVHNLKIY